MLSKMPFTKIPCYWHSLPVSARRFTRRKFILLYAVVYMTYLFFWVGVLVFYDLLLKSFVVSAVGRRTSDVERVVSHSFLDTFSFSI